MTDAIVYAVASGKGGVGKTTTAVNLGAGFANAGHSVVVVDLDLGMANLGDFLEATPAGPTLHDVLAGDSTLDDAISHADPGLDVILGSETLSDFGTADPTKFRTVLLDLRKRYDVVLLDSGGGLSHDAALPLGLADSVILVSTVEEPAIQNTAKTLELAELIDGTVAGLILTRSGGGKEADPTSIAKRLDLRLIGTVPEDSTVADSARAGETLLSYDADSPAAQAYLEIVYDLLDEPLPMNLGTGTVGSSLSAGAEREDDEVEATGPVQDAETSFDASGEDDETTADRDDVTAGGDDEVAGEDDETTEDAGEVTIGEIDEGAESAAHNTNVADESTDEKSGVESDEPEDDGEAENSDEEKEDGVDREADSVDREADAEQEQATGTDDSQERQSRSLLSRLTGGLFG